MLGVNIMSLISVYITTINRFSLLKRAVESVLSQDYRNIELVVVDCPEGEAVYYLWR